MIAKVLSKDTTLGEQIQMLFWEQSIIITSILMAIGMVNGVLVEALLPGRTVAGGKPPPEDEKGVKEWLRNKLRALGKLLSQLGAKAAKALLSILGVIIVGYSIGQKK